MNNNRGMRWRRRSVPVIYLAVALHAVSASAAGGGEISYEKGLAAYRSDDLITAMRELEVAAGAGHAKAQYLLGFILDNAEDNARAKAYYEKAAAQGDADAAYALGVMYSSGDGVGRDDASAVSWYQRATSSGHGPAAEKLGHAYLHGELGLEVDREKGLEILRATAAAGHQPAQALLDAHADNGGSQ